MVRDELEELLLCLGSRRRVFRYYQDRYAPLLLGYAVGDGAPVRRIKQGSFASLLEKTGVKRVLAQLADGFLEAELTEAGAPDTSISYLLTLDQWGTDKTRRHDPYYQTSRPGKNLVLQINFNRRHDEQYRKLFSAVGIRSFNSDLHPVVRTGRTTLAWARIDLDLKTGEALIEEVQNDWIRAAYWRYRYLSRSIEGCRRENMPGYYNEKASEYHALHRYLHEVLAPHVPIWDEAALMAAILFLREEVGVRTIYYHTFESGNRIKKLRYAFPPRRLYSALPRQFCFRVTERIPEFLLQDRRWARRNAAIIRSLRFHLLEL